MIINTGQRTDIPAFYGKRRIFVVSTLVAYFSVEGTTEKIAQQFADRIRAEVFEIKPRKPYSELDILWVNPLARVNQERFFKRDVPAFVTSDTTGVGGIKTELKPYLNGAAYVDAKLLKDVSEVGSLSLYG